MATTPLTNWAGNVAFSAERLGIPESISELRAAVAGAGRVRVLGTGHSFSDIADTPDTLISLRHLPETFEVTGPGTVRVAAGITLADLAVQLHRSGLALHNLPSLPHISLAGACATATHGSGDGNGSLAGAVRSMEVVAADGSLTTVSRGDAAFDGAVVALGALGVVTHLELDVVPAFDVEQRVYEGLPWPVLTDRLDEVFAAAYSVSVFTDWRSRGGDSVALWVKHRVGDPAADLAWTGARPAEGPRHPIPAMPPENCTQQLGVPGPWHERLPHFRAEFTPSAGEELQSEFFVPRHEARNALLALDGLRARIAPVLQISELRSIAADPYWLSPHYQRPNIAFHFTWIPDADAVRPVVRRIEEALAPWDVRPHWGKVFTLPPAALAASYPRWSAFRRLMRDSDPLSTFQNPFLEGLFG
ncbi:FAD-binding protein [Streptomyces pathocidini]|uniref:FAD-binding protein n=1 Tax=Streptomyces pathocidini TaxID=1650571 RepID=A0ABW7UVJ5_9ACTN|nr:FAD-binding protein [Streptomyces pathocidini]